MTVCDRGEGQKSSKKRDILYGRPHTHGWITVLFQLAETEMSVN